LTTARKAIPQACNYIQVAKRAPKKNIKVGHKEADPGHHALFKGLVLSAGLVLIVLFFLPVRYEGNDELALIKVVSGQGGIPADPNFQLVINQVLSYCLYFFYKHWPSTPWLGMLMYSAVYLGGALFFSLLFKSRRAKYALLALPPFILFLGYCLAAISITAASLILEFAVFLCLMEWAIKERCPVKHFRWYGLFLVFCFFLSFSLRWRLVLYSLFFAVPILFFLDKNRLRKTLPFLIAVMVIIVGDRALFYYTSTDEYKAFAEYNMIRAVFNDTARGEYHGEITLKALDKAGWSFDDYNFFRNWILYDEKVFNTENITTFTEANNPQNRASILELIPKRIVKSFDKSKHHTLVLAFSILSLFVYRFHVLLGLSRYDRLKIICSLGIIGAGTVFFMYYRFPRRVFVPLYAYLVGTSFLIFQVENKLLHDQNKVPRLGKISVVAIVVLVVLTLGQIHAEAKGIYRILETSKRTKDYIHKCLGVAKNRSIHGDPLLVLMQPTSGLGFETVHPLLELSDFPDVRIFPGGTRTNSPPYLDALRRIGLGGGREFLQWTINNEEVLFVLIETGNKGDQIIKYLWESYFSRRIAQGRNAKLVPVHDFRNRSGAGIVFYSMISAN